jgi:hypothetical protein
MTTKNTDLNALLTLADYAYDDGNLDEFDAVLATIERHFYGLSIIPNC